MDEQFFYSSLRIILNYLHSLDVAEQGIDFVRNNKNKNSSNKNSLVNVVM